MKVLISCEFPDFNSAELAMREISRINPNKVKISINKRGGKGKDADGRVIISALPIGGTSSLSFPVASMNAMQDEPLEYELKESCHLLAGIEDAKTAKRISAKLRSFGAVGLKEIKY